MNIAIALNRKYYRYTYVFLTSLCKHHPCGSLFLHILHNDLTETEKQGLTQLLTAYGHDLTFYSIMREDFPAGLPVNDMWTLETYFRLKLIDLLPEHVDRLLYLDVDIIVNQNLEELYNTDFEGNDFIACADMGSTGAFTDIRGKLFNDRIAAGYQYFNAGVMLWNLSLLRHRYSFSFYMNLAEELNFQILAPDQDLLNYAHYGHIKYADEYRYNLWGRHSYNCGIHYQQARDEAAIIHYTGYKPWDGQYVHYDIEQIWWDYASQTPFYTELMEEFLHGVLNNPLINDTLQQMSDEKAQLIQELTKTRQLCQKLSALL